MKSPLFTSLFVASALTPAIAFANPGHVADHGGGHSHWGLYVLLAIALFGASLWARSALRGR